MNAGEAYAVGRILGDDAKVSLRWRQAGAGLVGVDDGEANIGILARPVETDAAQIRVGDAVRELLPRLAAIGRFVHAAARSVRLDGSIGVGGGGRFGVADEGVELIALAFPGGKHEGFGIARMHDEIHDASLLVEMPNTQPFFSAVRGLEQAAFFVGAIETAEGADVDDVGILGVDDDFADLEGELQAHVFPGLAAVGGLVDAVAEGDAVARVGLAGADPDDMAIAGRDGDSADRYGIFLIELMREG